MAAWGDLVDSQSFPSCGPEVQRYLALPETIAVVRRPLRASKTVAQMQRERILRAWGFWGKLIPNLNTDYSIAPVSASCAGAQQGAAQPSGAGEDSWRRFEIERSLRR